MAKILLNLFLCLSTLSTYAQASWTYSIWFKLKDKKGKEITRDDFESGKVKVYTGHAYHKPIGFTFDSKSKLFSYQEGTIVVKSTLLFTTATDTLVLHFPTRNMLLPNILLSQGELSLNEVSFAKLKTTSIKQGKAHLKVPVIKDDLWKFDRHNSKISSFKDYISSTSAGGYIMLKLLPLNSN